jgi:pimeloyl-ACP methyl ester carboxylesterase
VSLNPVTAVLSRPNTDDRPDRFESPLPVQIWEWQGHRIQYVSVGTGTPLLLLHGFGASIGHWKKNIPVLAAAGYQVFALDLLGFGGSAKPALDYSMELWQDLVMDFWRAHIQRPMVVVGNSIGGLLSLMILANHPEQVLGGVLLNPAGSLNHRPEDMNPLFGQVMGTFSKLASSAWLGPWLFDQIRSKSRIRNSLKQIYRNPIAITNELVEMLYQPSCDPGAQPVFAAVLSAPPGPRPGDLLPQITAPVLVLWGEDDPWTPIQAAAPYAAAEFEIIPIPRTGHCPHDERPEIVNPCILTWLRQQNL